MLAAWADQYPYDGVEVFTLARSSHEVRCAKGLQVRADFTWNDVPAMDVLVYPGGGATRHHLGDSQGAPVAPDARRWRDVDHERVHGCVGAADAGLLDGVQVHGEERFIDNGLVITAAGVSAGIDMALHLVARLHAPDRARAVRRYIQYDPRPPI